MSENATERPFWGIEGQISGQPPLETAVGESVLSQVGIPAFSPSAEGGLIYIEQVAVSTCKNVPFLVGKNESKKVAVLFRPRCKLWSCQTCRKTNADLWCLRATLGASTLVADGLPLHLVTVTGHEKLTTVQALRALPQGWDSLRKRWHRRSGKAAYMLVPELGKETRHFHIHLITNNSPGTRWWKDNARACGFGYQADDSDTFDSPPRAGFYIGKYLYKQFQTDEFAKGMHRVRTSQTWPKLPPLERDPDWLFSLVDKKVALQALIDDLARSGFRVALGDHKSAWSVVDAV